VSRPNIEELFRVAGITALTAESPIPIIAEKLRALRAKLNGADPLDRATIRAMLLDFLKDAKVPGAADLVTAALAVADPDGTTQGSAVTFAPVEPWPDPVAGTDLLARLVRTYARFIVLPEGGATASALWVVHAHAHEAAHISPNLGYTSPEKGCGKTTALHVTSALVPRPLPASNITAAALFRAVEKFRPTLLIDEADTFLAEREELRGILNSGHTRATAVVVRTAGDDFEPRTFSTWCPKAVALIGDLPPTLEDRSIVIRMRRRAPSEAVERLRLDRLAELEPLRRQAARWAVDNLPALKVADPALPEELRDRARDNWRLLVAIAELAGGPWPARARKAAALLSGGTAEGTQAPAVQLLADLRDLFRERGVDRLASADMVEVLTLREDRPWPEWKGGRPLTVRQLARLVGRFGVTPKPIRLGDKTPRGYLLEQFADAFARYLPSDPQQAQQASSGAENSPFPIRNTNPSVADDKSGENPHGDSLVADVADEKGGLEGEAEKGDAWEPEP